jgi:hypothetical protein
MDKAILDIVDGKKIGTFFTKKSRQSIPVDVQAVKGFVVHRLKIFYDVQFFST